MKKAIDLSVIILNYNTVDLTRLCLLSVFASRTEHFRMEVIVCDNASSDNSLPILKREFPKAIFVDNKNNIGFAAGNNAGIRLAQGRYILLLNSDTEVTPLALAAMIRFMDEHPQAGASTCKLLLPDGSMDPACHRGFPTPWVAFTYLTQLERLFPKTKIFGEYHQLYKDMSKVHDVDCISGAFFLVRREILREVGLLDEAFFMYGEDIDWAYRVKAAGWRILFNPDVTVLHKKKQSGRANVLKNRRVTTEIYFHTYNWLFYRKHFAQKYPAILTFLVNTFYAIRLFMLKRFSI